MKIKEGKVEEFNRFVETNSSDGYSYGVVKYMNKWTEMMESEITMGKTVAEAAQETEHKADAG